MHCTSVPSGYFEVRCSYGTKRFYKVQEELKILVSSYSF